MNSENIKNNDPIQLKQMIIFLKAELTKYVRKVKEYEDGYHYSVVENLEQENAQLTIEKNELSKKLHELQRKKYNITLDNPLKTKMEWLPINKQLNEVMEKLNDGVTTDQNRSRNYERQIFSLHKKFAIQNSLMDQLEYRLVELIQKTNNKVHTQIENLSITIEERFQFEGERQRFAEKIEEKNTKIETLQHEIVEAKEQYENEALLQLERHIKDVLAKSVDHEKKLNAKLDVFEIERQRFTKEIEEKNTRIETLQHEIIEAKEHKENEALLQLERKIKDVLAKSVDYEKNLNAKLDVFEIERQRFTKEIEEKNTKIETLQHETIEAKEHKETEAFLQLEQQIKDTLAKLVVYEEKLDAKLDVFEFERQQFVKEIENNNNTMKKLQSEISLLIVGIKIAEDSISTADSKSGLPATPEVLLELEDQMKEVVTKSLEYERKIDAKLTVLKELEIKLDRLTEEITEIEFYNKRNENST